MNMRFMKRKHEPDQNSVSESKKESSQGMEWSKTIDSNQPSDVSHQEKMPQVASDFDMYGIGAEVIGRRSFRGFNKAVEKNYNETLEQKLTGKARRKAGKAHISDEEMLKRYENYVKGEDNNDVKPIGNLEKKGKRRNKKAKMISQQT